MSDHECRAYWNTHGCCRQRGHEGPHICRCVIDAVVDAEDNIVNVGVPPYYGPDTKFFGEDA